MEPLKSDYKPQNYVLNLQEPTLLFHNLLLLGLDLLEMRKLNLPYKIDTFEIERKENQKILAFLLHFLLQKLTDGVSISILKPFFPIRAPTDFLGFKKEAFNILKELEKDGKIPKDFILSRNILDFCAGGQIVHFLRNLSEFTVYFELSRKFPTEKIENFEFLGNKRTPDINSIYEINPDLSEKTLENKIKPERVKTAIKGCYVGIVKQRKRFQKMWEKYNKNTDIWTDVAKSFTEEYTERKKSLNNLIDQNQELNEIIPSNFLKEFRALDRIQLIDLSKAFFHETKKISENMFEKNILEKIEDFYQDSDENNVLNKITKESLGNIGKKNELVHLDEIYEKWNKCLEKTKQEIPEEEDVLGLAKRLKETNEKIKKNKEKIIRIKEDYGDIIHKYSDK